MWDPGQLAALWQSCFPIAERAPPSQNGPLEFCQIPLRKDTMWQHGIEPILPTLNPFISSRIGRQSCGSIPCDQSRGNHVEKTTTTTSYDQFILLYDSVSYDSVSCNSQAGHMSGDSIERARRARSTWVAIAPQQNALPDFSQIRPRPRQMNVWVALLDFFSWICKLLSMCCSTCSNMKFAHPKDLRQGRVRRSGRGLLAQRQQDNNQREISPV